MDCPTRPRRVWALALGLALSAASAAADSDFPYDRELFLDAPPIGPSRRIPSLEVGADGVASIDLYCASGSGQITVSGAGLSILVGPLVMIACSQEGQRSDDELRDVLASVTAWRRDGDDLLLIGSRTLRFRPGTN